VASEMKYFSDQRPFERHFYEPLNQEDRGGIIPRKGEKKGNQERKMEQENEDRHADGGRTGVLFPFGGPSFALMVKRHPCFLRRGPDNRIFILQKTDFLRIEPADFLQQKSVVAGNNMIDALESAH